MKRTLSILGMVSGTECFPHFMKTTMTLPGKTYFDHLKTPGLHLKRQSATGNHALATAGSP